MGAPGPVATSLLSPCPPSALRCVSGPGDRPARRACEWALRGLGSVQGVQFPGTPARPPALRGCGWALTLTALPPAAISTRMVERIFSGAVTR